MRVFLVKLMFASFSVVIAYYLVKRLHATFKFIFQVLSVYLLLFFIIFFIIFPAERASKGVYDDATLGGNG